MRDAIAQALLPRDVADHAVFRTAVVSSTSPLQIDIAGATAIDASRLAHYTATIGDTVRVEQTGDNYLIHGKIA